MKIILDPSEYFRYSFEFKYNIVTIEFLRWLKLKFGWKEVNFKDGKWRFNNLEIANLLMGRFPEIEMSSALREGEYRKFLSEKERDNIVVEEAAKIKEKVESDLVIKGLKKEIYPYQKLGVEFFINNGGKAILADTMGLGKTVQSLAYVVHEGLDKVIVVCPSSVKYSWECEVKKWTHLKPYVIDSKKKNMDNGELMDVYNNYDVFIINYDILKSFYPFLSVVKIDCVIMDEFHYIKNSAAVRTKYAKKLSMGIPRRILLSGTPLLSRPEELFNGLNLMDPAKWNNWYSFTKRYCAGHSGPWGYDTKGSSNVEELQGKIARYFLRRKKEEVLPELPDKIFIDLPVQLSPTEKFKYDLAYSDFVNYLDTVKNKSIDEINRSMAAESLVKLGELRRITSEGKLDEAIELIQDIIDSGEKVVVFSCYNAPLMKMAEKFKEKAVTLTGDTSEIMRRAAIDRFQNDSSVQVFLGGIKSAGVGITLTAGSNVVFLDFSWVPGDHQQAQDRIHRIGQKAEKVNIYQLFAKDTIDEKMKNLLEGKQEIFDKLIDGEGGEEGQESGSLVSELMTSFKADLQPIKLNSR